MANVRDTLLKADKKDFKQFDLNGRTLICRVLSVHDADTVNIGWLENGELVKTSCRLVGIDSPEITSKVAKEKALAFKGRDWFRSQVLDKIVRVECDGMDKYGRLLGVVFADAIVGAGDDAVVSFNDQLVQLGFARAYGVDGNLHKDQWSDAELTEPRTTVD